MRIIPSAPGIITLCETSLSAREEAAAAIQKATGAHFIPPYNYGPTISGQGTQALEFLEQVCLLFTMQPMHPEAAASCCCTAGCCQAVEHACRCLIWTPSSSRCLVAA